MTERVLIDACVLYPTVLREIVLGAARAGLFQPLWSARILEEWARAAGRGGAVDETIARGEVALLQAEWPDAEVAFSAETAARLSLPDPDDVHVLAAAIDGGADTLLTLNLKDFPTRTLSAEGILRRDPDGFLTEFLGTQRPALAAAVTAVVGKATELSGRQQEVRPLLKRARLPRLGKALG